MQGERRALPLSSVPTPGRRPRSAASAPGHPGPARGRREAASGRVKSGGDGAGRALRAVGRRGWDRPSAGTATRDPCRAAPGETRGGLGT